MTAIIVQPGDHDCDTPGPQVDLAQHLHDTTAYGSSSVRWRCPECGSRWRGTVDFYKTRHPADAPVDYHRALRWERTSPSSWRWKRRTKRSIERAHSGSSSAGGAA